MPLFAMFPPPRLLSLALLAVTGVATAERPYVNDQRVPKSRHDLEVIQQHLQQVLPQARAATVCIDLGEGSGSGVVVSADGLILTAAHVTGGVDKEFTVRFEDGQEAKAKSLGLNSETDSAMARIIDEGEWPHVEIEREDSTELGDWVFALGHPGGYDDGRGSVVRLGRLVRMDATTWQSDCNLIGGDSGGPLFDLEGRLIAIHSRVGNRLPENMHVPMSEYLAHWEQFEEKEFLGEGPFAQLPEKGKGFLGIGTEARAEGGLVVVRVGDDTPAAEAGIVEGDVILRLGEVELNRPEDLKSQMKELAPEDRVALTMLREGREETLVVKLGER